MDDFKIKSLDDFDSMFMSSKKAAAEKPAAPVNAPVQQPAAPIYNDAPVQQPAAPIYNDAPVQQPAAPRKESLIPEMETGPVEISFFEIDGVPVGAAPEAQKPVSNVYTAAPVTPAYNPAPAQTFGNAPQSVQPPVSLYQSEGMKDNSINQFLYEPDRTDDINDDYAPEKSGSGALPTVAKIASIVMLALTLLAFVAGCFITIFLNNKDSKCGSISFATLTEDAVNISGGSSEMKSGSLVICKSLDISEYAAGDIIAVPTYDQENKSDGCKLYQVVGVDTASKIITYADPAKNDGTSSSCTTDDIYGVATYNFGGLGKVISFASNNAVLVCILFLLLAALWCLFIILIEKSQEKKAPKEETEEDVNDNGGLSF